MPHLTAGALATLLGNAKADWSARDTTIEDLQALEVAQPSGTLITSVTLEAEVADAVAAELADYTPTAGLAAALAGDFEPLITPAVLAVLGQDSSAGYVEAEAQAVVDKLDALITALQGLGILAAA